MPNVTADFQLFSIDGLCVKFTLSGDTETPAQWANTQIDQFLRNGYRTEPVEGNLKPQIIPVVGYVRTTTQDPNNPGQYKPALALFSPWGDFTALTIYAEKLPELPFEPTGKVWDGGAFDRNLITSKGYMTKCDFKVMKEPIIGMDGKPKLTDSGNQKWRFVRVVEMNGKPIDAQPPATVEGEPAPESIVTTQPAPAPNGNGASQPAQSGKPSTEEAKKATIRSMFVIAKAVYGEAGASAAMLKIGQAVSKNDALTGLSQLTTDQLAHVDAILQLQRDGINEYGDIMEWSEALPVLLQEYGKESVYDLTPHQIAKLRRDITSAPADKGGDDAPLPKKKSLADIPF